MTDKRKSGSDEDAGPVETSAMLPIGRLSSVKVIPATDKSPAVATITFRVMLTEEWPKARALLDESMRLNRSVQMIMTVPEWTFQEATASANESPAK